MTSQALPVARTGPATPLAFMSVNTQFENAGDALINRELAVLLAEHMPTIIDFSRCPAQFRRTMAVDGLPNVEALAKPGFGALVAALLRARLEGRRCFLFLNPGGLAGPRTPRKALASAAYTLLLTGLRLAGVRICLVGVSFDAMPPLGRLLTRWRAAQLHRLAVRDQRSAARLRQMGVRTATVAPDLAFGLWRRNAPDPVIAPGTIALSFRFDRMGDDMPGHVERLVRRIFATYRGRFAFRFVVQVARDEAGMRALYEMLRDEGEPNLELVVAPYDLSALARAYGDCRAIYANRLHALLIAMRMGAAPVGVVRGDANGKTRALFEDLGIADHLLDLAAGDAPLRPLPRPVDAAVLHAQAARLDGFFADLLATGEAKATA